MIGTPMRSSLRYALPMILAATPAALFAQWLDYPTAGVPHTPDGKPNLAAPAPRTADGKPDFSGMWGWVTRANCGAKCNDTQISREFINIAASAEDTCALSAVGGGTGQETKRRAGTRSERSLHAARSSANLDRRLLQADFRGSGPRDHPDRAQYAVPADLHRWAAASEGSESDLERVLGRPLGRRHAGRGNHRLPRRSLVGCQRQATDGARPKRSKGSGGPTTEIWKSRLRSTIRRPTPRRGR